MSQLRLELYKKLYLIRRVEEKICEHYAEDEMRTPVHLSMGEEAIPVGVCCALKPEDQVFGTYRSHGIYLARTEETDMFFAELYGKETGLAKGKLGSMHLVAPGSGFIGTSAIVASVIPVAVGSAFANKQGCKKRNVAVFFGDGALDEGVFWESLNFACLMRLPVLFVCEDNGLAVHTPVSERQGYNSIIDIVSKFRCNVVKDETTDVEVIYKSTCNAIRLIETTQMPCFLYTKYYRYLEHVGVNEDFNSGYRSKDEFLEWYKRDPINLYRKKLLKYGINEKDIVKLEKRIDQQIERSIKLAKKASFPEKSELYKGVVA